MSDHSATGSLPNLDNLSREAFGALAESHRRELHTHCYRMMGSVEDAEEMVQETFLRAWRRRDSYAGRAPVRSWLYRIATNACLDVLDKRARRAVPKTYQPLASAADPIPGEVNEPVWLEPYPDDLLAADSASPESTVMRREHITLAFIVALQSLPPRQRAVLILRDVLDWRASEVADLLQTTVAAVKSALHRARSTLAEVEPYPDLPVPEPDLLEAYVRAWETANIPALLRLLTEDATFSMPPIPAWYRGRDEIAALTGRTIFSGDAAGRWRLLPTRANGQPAFGLYRASGDGTYSGYGIQALTLRRDGIADIITFRKPGLIVAFGLPAALTD